MVTCTACGKEMARVPEWMSAINVEYICNNCPKRQTKNIAFITLETDTSATKLPDDVPDVVEEAPSAQPVEAAKEEATAEA